MKAPAAILLCVITLFLCFPGYGQESKSVKTVVQPRDTVSFPISQKQLFVLPKRNMLITHLDATVGASKVKKDDRSSELGVSVTAKGLYPLTGALYVNMGLGVTHLASRPKSDLSEPKHTATAVTLPFGIGFTIGDDRAQIVNGIDLFPVYYVAHPAVQRARQFAWGFGVDLGFHIRIKERLHLGMMAKLQMFQPFDKDEHQSFPRYGFIGTGLLLRYD